MEKPRGGTEPKRGGRRSASKTAEAEEHQATATPADLLRLAGQRVAIEAVSPEINGGRFPAKAVAGEVVTVEADIFSDGHDKLDAAILWQREGETGWREAPMAYFDNDRWRGVFTPGENARHRYTIIAWRDRFESWRDEVSKKHAAGVGIAVELVEGRNLVAAASASERASAEDRAALAALLRTVDDTTDIVARFEAMMTAEVAVVMKRSAARDGLSRYPLDLGLTVDRKRAAISAWYELMPRSMSDDPGRHGTFDDVIGKLAYVRDMGFDVLYFPPIHPIGRTHRKGRNNTLTPAPDDPGSPYAIGSEAGGHDALHPELGSFEDFARLVAAALAHGLEIAIDFAIQCSPDHPWIKAHPEWFDWRPDGTIKYAENPPKKYQDIVNVDFYRDGAFPSLWYALRDIVLFWARHEVRIFRVDNPHTKPFPFWEWMIAEVQAAYPDAIFLAEAFTRPKVMKRLAKLGFTQSYSYFTWRNTKAELTAYLTELTTTDARFIMRPNFFVNTPDINPTFLQSSGRPGFRTRLVLAASLGGNYGVYSGFELCEATAVPGKEEYFDSEKYEIRAWDWDRPGNIRPDIALMNRLRNERPALQSFADVTFYNAWNDAILYYGKRTPDRQDFVLFAVNLDAHNGQGADFEVPLWEFGLPDEAAIDAEDLVTGARFTWHGKIQHVWLDPNHNPYAIWRLLPFDGGGR
jgi:starch synthase (maltosyl-transferring)